MFKKGDIVFKSSGKPFKNTKKEDEILEFGINEQDPKKGQAVFLKESQTWVNIQILKKYKMKTTIIAAFPGVGKTHFKDSCDNTGLIVSDSDSSGFSWMHTEEGKVRNPDFPKNYIEHIKGLVGKADYILVSSHKDVRSALVEAGLDFTLVFPQIDCKEIYLQRYEQRGSPLSFILLIDKFWVEWINELHEQKSCTQIELPCDTYLSDYINRL